MCNKLCSKTPGVIELKGVTRLEIIDHKTGGTGRVYSARPCSLAASLQDNGKTLKIFITDPPIGAKL